MKIQKVGQSGTLESSDILITVEQGDKGIQITLTSSVKKQFGKQIKKVIQDELLALNIEHANVIAVDKGALDCTIRARTKAACKLALEEERWN